MNALTITTDLPEWNEYRQISIPGNRLVKHTKTTNEDGTETIAVTYRPESGIIPSNCGDGTLYDIIIGGRRTVGWRNGRSSNHPWTFNNKTGNREFAADMEVTVTGIHNPHRYP